ncbi:MAG: hypothetical protein ACXWDT_05260 [Solirubrobacterales bacterium]
MPTHVQAQSRPRWPTLSAGFALFAAIAAIGVNAGLADAAAKVMVLGSSNQTAAPACPQSPCQAIGKVTGFQTSIGQAKKPFLAPFDGRIVAWSIKTSAPDDKQKQFFDEFYGGPPSARISVLKPIKKSPLNYKLRAQSPVEELGSVLGVTTTFTLKTPLTVRAGQVVAISVPTWAPVFAIGLPKGNAWRASRVASGCTDTNKIKAGNAHDAPGTERTYGCSYTTARLLYSATMVKTAAPKPTKPTKPPAKP